MMMVAYRQGKRQLPMPFDAEEMGRRFKEAMNDAGWLKQEDAVRAIRLAVPGTRFGKSDISALIGGYKMPQPDRLMAMIFLLGLDLRIIFKECFDDDDPYGHPVTRRSHPWLFIKGPRRLEWKRQGFTEGARTGS
jgi:hypothetical protein